MADAAQNLGSPHANVPTATGAGATTGTGQRGTQPAKAAGTPGAPAAPEAGKDGKPVAPEPAKEEAKVSPKLQMLIRREKQALERERTAKTKEEALTAREQALQAREAKIQEFESIKQTNPRRALELLGMSYQDLTLAELNDGTPTPDLQVKTVEGKVEALRKELEEKDRKVAEDAKRTAEAEETRALQDFQREIDGHIDSNADKYEFIRFESKNQLVRDVINKHYERTIDPETGVGKIMSIAEAADKVEAFLEARYEKALSLKKLSSRVVPKKPEPPKPQGIPTGHKPPAKTLTNTMSGSQAPKARPLTDQERVQKAIAYARGLRPQG